MDSRNFLQFEKLDLLIDSESLDSELSESSQLARKLLDYYDMEIFEFLRTPLQSQFAELTRITHFDKKLDANGHLHGLHVTWSPTRRQQTLFSYRHSDVERIGRTVLKKSSLTVAELDSIYLVFIKAAYNFKRKGLLITENPDLLKNRYWFEAHFPGGKLNITTLKEALEIMDLFAKSKGKRLMAPHFTANKGLWYWYSFRSKVPHYNVSSTILDAFATRFTYLLKSVDEIGLQYYSGVNNDTMDDTLYHFNYFVSLITGIFDSLAIEARDNYKITFDGDHIPSRISLNKKAGEKFLKEIRKHNSQLGDLIDKHADFINLIYQIRELVIHREGMRKLAYDFRNVDEEWKANFIVISKELADLIRKIGDKSGEYESISLCGLYKDPMDYHLEPFRLAKRVSMILAEFCNEYLRLLGHKDFISSLKPTEDFRKDIELCRAWSLADMN